MAVQIIRYLSRITGGKSRRTIVLSAAAIALAAASTAVTVPANARPLRPAASDTGYQDDYASPQGPILEHACRQIGDDGNYRAVVCADLLSDGEPQAEAVCEEDWDSAFGPCLEAVLYDTSYYGNAQPWDEEEGICLSPTPEGGGDCYNPRTYFADGIWMTPSFTADFWTVVLAGSWIELPDGTLEKLSANLGSGHHVVDGS
jgi:hypothetical protein